MSGVQKVARKGADPAPAESQVERCGGCDAEATQHPYVAVMHADDAAELSVSHTSADNPNWVGVPVCEACWRDPAHRVRPLKSHFFPRASARVGVLLAGSSDQVGGHL